VADENNPIRLVFQHDHNIFQRFTGEKFHIGFCHSASFPAAKANGCSPDFLKSILHKVYSTLKINALLHYTFFVKSVIVVEIISVGRSPARERMENEEINHGYTGTD
jgi:hypothetical protein